jgi:GntR family transcriptional regulator
LYFQLQELLKEKIEAGTWSAGEVIPSEPDLCESYQVSRTVVRQALSVLEQDGQLRRVRGRGTFVSAPKIEQRVGGVSRLLAAPVVGQQVRVLDHRTERAPERVSEQLGLAAGSDIVRVMSLLSVADAPVALFDSFFPVADGELVVRALDATEESVSGRPATVAIDLTRTTVAIETSFCSSWEADQLDIPVRGAVFVTLCTEFVQGTVDGVGSRPFEVVRGVYRVDRVRLHFDVPSNGGIPAALWELADA